MAKITANNIQTGSITIDRLSSSVVNSISSPLDSYARQTANAAFTQANVSTTLAQAAFNAANNASGGGGGASGGFINLNMPGTLNVPFTGTSR